MPEIHLNIWEQETSKKSDGEEAFLDIGFMFSINEFAKTIKLIFPWTVKLSDIRDLSSIVGVSDAIPAIFNESWAVSDHGGDYVVYDPRGESPSFSIVNSKDALCENDFEAQWSTGLNSRVSKLHAISIDIEKLKEKAQSASKATGRSIDKFYIRFRVLNVKKDFYCADADNPGFDISAVLQQRTEDVDFRLNVRRGAPPNLAKKLGRFVEFSKVHLFLMRSRDKDFIFQDKLFKAARSLEDEDFWARYSLKDPQNTSQVEQDINLKRVKKSLGYHWKNVENSKSPVKEFGTLARFRIVKIAIVPFIVWALILGLAGNMLLDFIKFGYSKWSPDDPIDAVCIKAGEGFLLPKQACDPSTTIDPVKGQTLKKD